jgi:hypothetical protein
MVKSTLIFLKMEVKIPTLADALWTRQGWGTLETHFNFELRFRMNELGLFPGW